jgi:hypothetical protein
MEIIVLTCLRLIDLCFLACFFFYETQLKLNEINNELGSIQLELESK